MSVNILVFFQHKIFCICKNVASLNTTCSLKEKKFNNIQTAHKNNIRNSFPIGWIYIVRYYKTKFEWRKKQQLTLDVKSDFTPWVIRALRGISNACSWWSWTILSTERRTVIQQHQSGFINTHWEIFARYFLPSDFFLMKYLLFKKVILFENDIFFAARQSM